MLADVKEWLREEPRQALALGISAVALLLSFLEVVPGPVDPAWLAVLLCGVPIIKEGAEGLFTRFDIKADVLVSLALLASVIIGEIFAAGEGVLIEPQLPGKEITCGILGEEAMPPILIEPVAGDYFDYESKYASGGARELCPAPVSPAVTAEVQRLALAAHKALGLKGYSRADFILGPDDSLHLLEVNTLPGMTPTSLVPQEAAQLGMDFGQLLEKLIELGMEQHAKA